LKTIIISIGDELILGHTIDTNAAWLSKKLATLGLNVIQHLTIPDDLETVSQSLRRAAASADVILVTGGLGPTDDDLTRHAIANVLGVDLELHQPSLDHIAKLFVKIGHPMSRQNHIQAMLPTGTSPIHNPNGTAPGIAARIGNAEMFVLPGVPREMKTMYDQTVAPCLQKLIAAHGKPQIVISRKLHTFGTGESNIAETLGTLMARGTNPVVNSTVADAIVTIRIDCRAPDEPAARDLIAPLEQEIRHRLGNIIFAVDDLTLAGAVADLLRRRNATIAVAESCTGGLLAKDLTDIAGSSDYFLCGWITYSNQAKTSLLKVDPQVIESQGAVSEEVARQLAQNARQTADSDYALAITGIAGPTGATPEKPLGLVYIALTDQETTLVEKRQFRGDRPLVRRRAVNTALNMLRLKLLKA
jgi:nicotinamide-nucleotide amidase